MKQITNVLLALLLIAAIAALSVGLAGMLKEQEPAADSTQSSGSGSDDGGTEEDDTGDDILAGYTIVSENLIKDYRLLEGRHLNNVGSTDENADYTTLETGIPVEAGKTYCFLYDGRVQDVSKVVYKTRPDQVAEGEWDPECVIGTADLVSMPITIPAGASYVFVSMYNEYTADWGDWTGLELVEVERATPALADLSGYTMLTLGDSLSESGDWQDYVQRDTYLSYENLAVGGTKINVFAEKVTEATLEGIDLVFVMGLFNSTGSVPGTVEDEPSNAENASVCAGYKYIVEKVRGLKEDVKIVLASPHRPRADDVAEKAKAVGEVAEYYGLLFIDLYNEAWGNTQEEYDLYLKDTVHSTSAGYKREAEIIAPYLAEELLEGHIVYDYSVTEAADRYQSIYNQYMEIADPSYRYEKFQSDEKAEEYLGTFYQTLYERLRSYAEY